MNCVNIRMHGATVKKKRIPGSTSANM